MNADPSVQSPVDYGKLFRVDGKVALISGGARGLGAEMARALCSAGARVMISDVLESVGRETVADIRAAGGLVDFVRLDTTQESQWEAAVAATIDRFGGLDVVVNNAGIERLQFITETTVEDFRNMMDVNVTGVFLGMKYGLPLLRRPGGAVVNFASTGGIKGANGMSAYVASKHAVIGLTRCAAIESGPDGLRINAICPGPTAGRMIDSIMGSEPDKPSEMAQARMAMVPSRRFGEPAEMASVTAFLLSDAAGFVNGACYSVDGGISAI